MIKLTIDGKEIEAEEGKSLLDICLENGFYIPNLCYMSEMENPPASCRLCFVEINGKDKPVISCRLSPKAGMVVRTDTAAVRRLQRTSLRLILSVHCAACRACPSNRKCELQRMARFLGVRLKPRRFEHLDWEATASYESAAFELSPARCVLCGKCIFVCEKRNGYSLLTFAGRGFGTVISSFGEVDPSRLPCQSCGACVQACPVSAIFLKG